MKSPLLAPYGTRIYKALTYAKMKNGEVFHVSEAKACLSGLFKGADLRDVRETYGSLGKNGLVLRVSPDNWVITEEGSEHIYRIVGNYRQKCRRDHGPLFMNYYHEQLAKVAEKGTFLSSEYLDEEDRILEELNEKIKARSDRKKASASSRSRARR